MSREQADVRSIEGIDRFRATLAGFVDAGRAALLEGESDLDRMILWLDSERMTHWKAQVRRRQELVTRAKSEVYRKQTQSSAKGGRAGDADERRNLRRAEERLEEARRRMAATKAWIRQLERERTLFKASVSPFATTVDHDLPHAIGLLRRMSENLEAYISMPPPDLGRLMAAPSDAGSSTRRTGTSITSTETEGTEATESQTERDEKDGGSWG